MGYVQELPLPFSDNSTRHVGMYIQVNEMNLPLLFTPATR